MEAHALPNERYNRMNRRQPSAFDALATTKWGVGLAGGFLVLLLGFVLLPALLSSNPFLARIGAAMQSGPLSMLVWLLAGMCWLASLFALIGGAQRRRLLDAQTGLDSLRSMSWRQFERLVAEAYRRQGYRVEECGQGGADGGVDLKLRRQGETVLVQCKQWRSQKVGAPVVREQFGLLAHHGADRVVIATVGEFTAEALAFAQGKPIELLNGAALVDMVRSVQSAPASTVDSSETLPDQSLANAAQPAVAAPVCPRCGASMVTRTTRASGARFLGCSRFPGCRGTRELVE